MNRGLLIILAALFSTAELFCAPETNQAKVTLSEAERTWLNEHAPIRVGVTAKWPPFSYTSTNGTQAGIDIDILRLISERTGVPIQIVAAASWDKLLDSFQQREIDVTSGTAQSPDRENLFLFTRPYFKSVVVVVTRENDWRFPQVSQLQKGVIAMPRAYVTTTELKKRLPSANIIQTETLSECFKLVAERKADATVANLFAVSQYLNEHPEKKLGISSVVSEFEFPLRFAVRREYPMLASALDKGLASISQEELDHIAERHLLFGLQGTRRTALLHSRIVEVFLGAALMFAVFLAWNFAIRKEVLARRKAESDLRDLNRSLEIFSHAISHDLKAPLRAIHGLSIVLKEDYHHKLDSLGQDYLDRIIAASDRMEVLVRDVLSYSQASRQDLSLNSISLDELLSELIGEFPPEQRSYFHVHSGMPNVRGNAPLLAQCIANLLSNAIKYVPPGRTPSVEISSEQKGSSVRLWIKDNGIGIAPENHERIFKIFQRVESPEYRGTGIGLAVVSRGIERMGGTVGVESELGHGASFWIELPLAREGKYTTETRGLHSAVSLN